MPSIGLGLGITIGQGGSSAAVVEPLEHVVASDAATETNDVQRTFVTVIPADSVDLPLFPVAQMRFTVQGAVSALYVGHRAGSGDAYDAASLVQVTFNGGSPGVAQAVGAQTVSDLVTFAWDRTTSLSISADLAAGDQAYSSFSGASNYFKDSVAEAGTADKTGYSFQFSGFGVPVVEIEALSDTSFHPIRLFAGGEDGIIVDATDPISLRNANPSVPGVGEDVVQILDISGNGNTLIPSATWSVAPVLAQDGAAYFLDFGPTNAMVQDSFTMATPCARVASWRRNDGEGAAATVFSSSGTNTAQLEYADASSTLTIVNGGSNVAGLPLGEGQDIVTTEIFDGAGSSLAFGVDGGTSASGDPGSGTPAGLRIGGDHTASNWADISLYRMVYINRLPTAGELADIRAWCAAGIP